MKKRVFFTVILLLVLSPVQAFARATSFDSLFFKPATDTGYYLTTEGSRALSLGEFSIGMYADYQRNPLRYVVGTTATSVLPHMVTGHFYGAVGFTDWLHFGVNGDGISWVRFTDPASGVTSNRYRPGDTMANLKLEILDNTKFPVGIALVPFAQFPTGTGTNYLGNNSFAGGGKLVIDSIRFWNRVSLSLNAGYLFRDAVTVLQGTNIDDQVLFGLAGNVSIFKKYLDLIIDAHGATVANNFFKSEIQTPIEVDGALRLLLADTRLAMTFGGGMGITQGIGGPKYRAFLGIAYVPARILVEREVELREIKLTTSEDVFVLSEQCPYEETNFNPQRDNPNCEEIYYMRNVAGTCPPPDQYIKGKDNANCEKVYGFDVQDYDGDKIPDYKDQCPSEKESYNGFDDADGCPDKKPKVQVEEKIIDVSKIYFDYNRVTLKPTSKETLTALAEILKGYPQVKRFLILGHTDKLGPKAYNLELSQGRAKVVRNFLVSQGIDRRRLRFGGMGETKPLATNKTAEGRAINRRVEFKIIKWAGPKKLKKKLKSKIEAAP